MTKWICRLPKRIVRHKCDLAARVHRLARVGLLHAQSQTRKRLSPGKNGGSHTAVGRQKLHTPTAKPEAAPAMGHEKRHQGQLWRRLHGRCVFFRERGLDSRILFLKSSAHRHQPLLQVGPGTTFQCRKSQHRVASGKRLYWRTALLRKKTYCFSANQGVRFTTS